MLITTWWRRLPAPAACHLPCATGPTQTPLSLSLSLLPACLPHTQVIRLAGSAGKSPIVWQESFDQGVPLPPGTRVQVWKWWRDSTSAGGAAAVTAAGAPSGGEAGVLRSSRGEGAGDGLAAARRLAAQRPDGAAAQQLQQQQAAAAKPAATAAPSCALGQGCAGRGFQAEEAWKAELQVGGWVGAC